METRPPYDGSVSPMSSSGVRRINLYNFFAVLLPGTVFAILLIPLLPDGTSVGPVSAFIPLVAIGFVVGQALHTLGAGIQSLEYDSAVTKSHRELFVDLLSDAELPSELEIPDRLVEQFTQTVDEQYGDDPISELNSDGAPDREAIKSIYRVVRSRIHADGRGRSRVFQSIYAFCRSTRVTIPAAGAVYVSYAILDFVNLSRQLPPQIRVGSGNPIYTPIIARTLDQPLVVIPVAIVVSALGYLVFRQAGKQYKRYYVEYTLADYVVISDENTPPDSVGDTLGSGNTGSSGGPDDPGTHHDGDSTETAADGES